LGRYGLTDAAARILDGTFIPPDTTDYWTKEWLKEMERPPNYTPMTLDRSLEEHEYGWKKVREGTSSSPFGLRFAHYMAHTNSVELSAIDHQLASIPLLTGTLPLHWQQGMNAWLLKKPGEFQISKMRTILLYDAAFNQNSKWTGRAAMQHAERLQHNATTPLRQAMAPKQFGSRK
jgi:hypothetical protein